MVGNMIDIQKMDERYSIGNIVFWMTVFHLMMPPDVM